MWQVAEVGVFEGLGKNDEGDGLKNLGDAFEDCEQYYVQEGRMLSFFCDERVRWVGWFVIYRS